MPALDVTATDPGSRARAGVIHTAHGDVRTPAFVPLATKGSVRGLEPGEVAALGYDMVLGNTFHLMLVPGAELIARRGGLHRFMRWDGPIITDSGGFQVFSMGHGTVADEIKGTGKKAAGDGAILAIEEAGVRFRSYVDGAEWFMGPEESMAVQAALGSDIALAFDECTPFHASRDYTARSTERTHRWLERCLAEHDRRGPEGQLVYGIVQGGVHEDLRRGSAAVVAASRADGIAIGGSLGQHKEQMYEVVAWSVPPEASAEDRKPRHLLGIGDIDDLVRGVELGVDTFDCAMPTRLGRHGVAVVPEPDARWRVDLAKGRFKESDEPILDGCPCPACAGGYSRAYLRHLIKAGELLGQRLVTLHNLVFVGGVMADLREALGEGRLAEVAEGFRRGSAPASARARPAA
ncbi:MAG TPA: tRNA guanosine(34) transglycosylase Tgt [Solirubrobacteraceae bacterium]|jgi:queuine tRNA-ribosyltransferase|nr:tRNA guanosine(34) transglycosylase Tgt [Solirubrobacteraceae bacterium]